MPYRIIPLICRLGDPVFSHAFIPNRTPTRNPITPHPPYPRPDLGLRPLSEPCHMGDDVTRVTGINPPTNQWPWLDYQSIFRPFGNIPQPSECIDDAFAKTSLIALCAGSNTLPREFSPRISDARLVECRIRSLIRQIV